MLLVSRIVFGLPDFFYLRQRMLPAVQLLECHADSKFGVLVVDALQGTQLIQQFFIVGIIPLAVPFSELGQYFGLT